MDSSLMAAGVAGLPPGGTVRSLALDPSTTGRVLLGTTTGVIFVSQDGGSTWQFFSRVAPHDDWVVSSLVAVPGDSGHWFASLWSWGAPGGGVYESRDGGRSWQPRFEGHAVRALALAASAPRILVAATLDGVYRSQDAGQTWQLISPLHDRELANIESVAIDPADPREIYVGTWHLPWKTVNGGHDWWQMRQGVIDDSDVFSIAVDRQQPATVYLSACSGIYRSDNRGNLFRKIQGIPYTARRTPALVQDPRDPATIYAGTTQGLWVTHNGGAAWERITSPELRINAVLLLPGAAQSERILLGTDFAGVYASNDGGKTFAVSNEGFSNRRVSAVAESPEGRYVAVTGDEAWGGIFFEPANGGAAQQMPPPLANRDVYGLHWSAAGLLAATAEGVYWRRPALPAKRGPHREPVWTLVKTAPHDHVYALASPSQGSPTVYAASQGGLYKSEDGGQSWSLMREAPAPLYQVLALPAAAEADDAWIYVAGDGYVLRSRDQGRHFLPGRLAITGRINQLAWADLGGGRTLELAATSRGLYQSRDQGATWTLSGHGLPAIGIRTVHVQANAIFAAAETVGAVYRSEDGGVHWQTVELPPAVESLAREAPALTLAWPAAEIGSPGGR
ncbi:MAG TPA: hypothetical protein VN515_04575 [Terriglobales bacterium]|nr:hypothetical protein [Terriglobales bacterium]